MQVLARLLSADASLAEVARHLDELGHAARVEALARLSRSDQRLLYEAAKDAAPLGIDFFVDEGTAPRTSVTHFGTNTLPLPGRLRRFEKRFARPADGGERLFGYNEWRLRGLLGPGYFVAAPTSDRPSWQERGGVVIDYFQVPDGPVPEGWPEVVPNEKGLQRFVYRGTRDFIRRVSQDVSIGVAFKGDDRSLDHYFTLCREP